MLQADSNICERMSRSQELREFQRGTVTGCHLCNKSSREVSSKYSTVSCQWCYNKVEAIGNDSNSATKPRNMTERGQQMLRRRGRRHSAESVATNLQTSD